MGDPSTGEILVAERGRGAWALADRARLAATAESCTIVVELARSTAPGPA